MSAPRVCTVVLSWNRRGETIACLESLLRSSYPALEVICVDNGSSDGSADAVEASCPSVRLVRLPENRGFAGGMNTGIRAALDRGAEYVLVLNNDMLVDRGFVQPLVNAAQDPRVAAVCSQILFADHPDRIWYGGARFRRRRGHHGRHLRYGRPRLGPDVAPYPTDRACGGAMLMSRSILERIGLFDESLFAYAEDVEWSLRARAEGLAVLVVPASVVWHKVSASTGGESSPATIYYSLRNGLVVAERWAPLGVIGTLARRVEALLAHTAQALLFSSRRRAALRAVRAGFRDLRRHRLGPIV